MTERERFSAYILQEYNSNVVWHEGNPIKAMDLMLWLAWQAATQREGFRFVPVDTLDECLSWASVAKWDSPSEERDIEIDYHVGIIEAAIGAVDEQ